MENNIKIATVCGLCAGCTLAINETQKAVSQNKNVTLFKEIVHNKNVNSMLQSQGVNFCDELEHLPKDHTIILRAHGEPEATINHLLSNGYNFIDCTCINVKNIHKVKNKTRKPLPRRAEEGVGTKTFIGVNKWKTRLTKSLTV